MTKNKYKAFSNRLIETMKAKGHIALRSPNGICIQKLAQFSLASEQICRRYIRGDALPDYEKIKRIASHLEVSPGWLLFGEENTNIANSTSKQVDEDVLHYILKRSHHLYREETGNTDDYADFVLELIQNIREIDTSKDNLQKIINLAIHSISSYQEKRHKQAL